MQAEAGQPLDMIIRRKELERAIGDGVFYWGIGNALGASIFELLRRTSTPEVLFSVMRAKPKREDVTPGSLLLWTEYIDVGGLSQPLPSHALVLSRGDTASGVKRRHYALVCYSDAVLSSSSFGTIDLSHFKNVGGTHGRVGYSQVTANIEHIPIKEAGVCYDISLRAVLGPPYFIRLAEPRKVLDTDRKAIDATVAANPTPDRWRQFIEDLRNRPDYARHPAKLLALSSG